MNKLKKNRSIIITAIIVAGLAVWFCYPIFPWEDTYGEYLLGDMEQLYSSPYKAQFEENQDISKFETNNDKYRFVYLFANGKDIYYITESAKEMGKELHNLKGDTVAKLYSGSFNTLCGVNVVDNKLYYVYGNLHGRQAIGSFVKDAATVETDGKKQLLSTVVVLKPNFAVYDLSADKVTKISKKDYINTVNRNKTEANKNTGGGEADITNLINQSNYFKGAPKELYLGKASQGSFSDQGVTVKYLAAFSDGEAVHLFFDVTDTGAGLFGKGSNGHDFSLDDYDFTEKAGYNDSKVYDLVSYNEKTRTATLYTEYIGPLQNDNLSFHIYSMNGNQKMIDCTLDDIDLYGQLEKTAGEFEQEDQYMGNGTSFGIFDEKTGETKNVVLPEFNEDKGDSIFRLKADVLALPVRDEEGSHVADITNIGWRNGWLHVQINPENNIKWDTSFNLKNKKTGELLYSPYNISFGTGNGDEQDDYYEYMFYVGDMTKKNLDYSIIFNKAPYRATDLKGDWAIKFAIPDTLIKKLEANRSVPVKDHELLIQRAVVSPVNITLFASRKDVPETQINWYYGLSADDLELKLIYQNGKTADIPKKSGSALGNQKGDMFRFKYTAENFDDITGLEVNGVVFPVAK